MTGRVHSFNSVRVMLATISFAVLFGFASAASVLAGGFQISVSAPEAAQAKIKDAVLVVRTFGCFQPADANVTITAEGTVNGRRQTVPVELQTDGTGVYAIRQQWPSEGKWVLVLTGNTHGMTSTVFVELGENGKVYPDTQLEAGNLKGTHARGLRRRPTAGDVEAALKANIGSIAVTAPPSSPSAVPSGAIAAGGAGAFLFLIGLAALRRRRAATK